MVELPGLWVHPARMLMHCHGLDEPEGAARGLQAGKKWIQAPPDRELLGPAGPPHSLRPAPACPLARPPARLTRRKALAEEGGRPGLAALARSMLTCAVWSWQRGSTHKGEDAATGKGDLQAACQKERGGKGQPQKSSPGARPLRCSRAGPPPCQAGQGSCTPRQAAPRAVRRAAWNPGRPGCHADKGAAAAQRPLPPFQLAGISVVLAAAPCIIFKSGSGSMGPEEGRRRVRQQQGLVKAGRWNLSLVRRWQPCQAGLPKPRQRPSCGLSVQHWPPSHPSPKVECRMGRERRPCTGGRGRAQKTFSSATHPPLWWCTKKAAAPSAPSARPTCPTSITCRLKTEERAT